MKFSVTLTTVLLHLLLFTCLHATTYYVSESGDDMNAGSETEPWASIQFALDHVVAGDTVTLLGGTYFERVTFNVSGTAGMPIVLKSASGSVATIDGSGTSGQDALIEIFDQSFITISGLVLINNIGADAQGILVEGNCQSISILNNEISDINFTANSSSEADPDSNAQPIIVYGSDGANPITGLMISGNNVHDCNTGYSEGIAVNGNVDGFTIINNKVSNITNIGIDAIGGEGVATANDQARNGLIMDNDVKNCISPYASAAGIYVDGGADIVIESNLITGCQWGIEVGCENPGLTASGITVKNNFLYNNEDAAIAVGGYQFPTTGRVTNSIIRNNTALSNDANPGGIGGITGQLVVTATDNVQIFNNIFYKTNGAALMMSVVSGSTSLVLNYNIYHAPTTAEFDYEGTLYDSLESYQLATAQDLNSLKLDPKFTSAVPGVNFHLANASSPAINAGDPATSISTGELDGYKDDNRINDDTIDIGADEFGSILPVRYLKPFNAYLNDGVVEMSWHTAEEIDNDHFEVQRSKDLSDWETVYEVQAKGISSIYEATDPEPMQGSSYYRLKQIDLDGVYDFSAIQEVRLVNSKLNIYPNPATDYFNIVSDIEKIEKVILTDISGKIIRIWSPQNNDQTIATSDLHPGLYFLRIQGTGVSENIKLFLE